MLELIDATPGSGMTYGRGVGHQQPKFVLKATDPVTGEVKKTRIFYDRYTVECFAAEWHMKYRTLNIWVGDDLFYGTLSNLKLP